MEAVKPFTLSKASDVGFAVAIAVMLAVLFLPMPVVLVDLGLALSISLSILILMVALWIDKPLDFSAFPLVLLIVTMLRLTLNVATTRLILSHGNEGTHAAGNVVGGFAQLVMSGDFVIGVIVFVILLTVNFIVITKGATRIAEVGARFTLDAIPGKQMAIDADLSAGLIDEREARSRRLELEQESSFYGSMDGASKFVRGDAIAGLIITFVNCFGGIIIGVVRHGMDFGTAADVFVKLSVGDGLVTQVPALIVSLAAGILVSKGGNKGTVEKAVVGQLGGQPRALMISSAMLGLMALAPGLPFLPFAILSAIFAVAGMNVAKLRRDTAAAAEQKSENEKKAKVEADTKSVNTLIRASQIELQLGKQLSGIFLPAHAELAHRISKIRQRFAQQFGFVIPEIKLSDDITMAPKTYAIRIHSTSVATYELRPGEVLVIAGGRPPPDVPCEEAREPAYGLDAYWVPEMFADELRMAGYSPFDPMSVMLTHLSEVIRNNLSQLLSYRDLRAITDSLEPEYKRLLEEITPSLLSFSSLQAILRMLLAERVSIRNLHLVLEAIAEIAPHSRKPETVAEHVRMRMAQQICGDIAINGTLNVLRLGSKWDATFLSALKRDAKGEVLEFDIEPRILEAFAAEATKHLKPLLEKGTGFAVATTPEVRPYLRMILDRLFPNLPVLSHVEVAKAVKLEIIGALS